MFHHLHTLSQRPPTAVFQQLMMAVAVVAAVVHITFIGVFEMVGVPQLAWGNLASVLAHTLAGLLIRRGQNRIALPLIGLELVLHGVATSWLIGWESGFHFYIVLTIPVIIVSSMTNGWLKLALTMGMVALYVGLDWRFHAALPMVQLHEGVLTFLHYFNLTSSLIVLCLLCTTYYWLVSDAQRRLHELASTDPLTSLLNRRAMKMMVQREAAARLRQPSPMSVLVADIDHFKRINDQHGHEVGDDALRAVADVLRDGVRVTDHVARWGGEEFLILLPGSDVQEAQAVAERLRQSAQALVLESESGKVRLALTVGVTHVGEAEGFAQAVSRADQALYQGKQQGRNRVVVHAPNVQTPAPTWAEHI